MTSTQHVSTLLAVFALSIGTAHAAAIPMTQPPAQQGWQITVGAAAVATPLFLGDDELGLSLVPDLRVRYGERFFASIPEGIGFNALLTPSLKAGPLVKLRFGREQDDGDSSFLVSGKTADLKGMGDIDPALEWGGFLEYRLHMWRTRLELRQGTGGHEGLVADLNFSLSDRAGPVRYVIGPRLTLASDDFVQTYFGITPAQSLGSGLPSDQAKGGLVSAGLGGSTGPAREHP